MTKTMPSVYESSFKLHITNILDIDHCPITCLGLNKLNTQLALFRGGDAPSIEIWSVSHFPFLQKVLYDLETSDGKPSVEGLVWIQNRVFSCGLHGFIVEHDLATRRIKGKYAATSGPIWHMSANPDDTLLAAGTEDGFVNIFQVVDDGLLFVKVLDRQEGRVLCLSWSPCGKYIATGSVDNVRLWDVERGHAVQRLITGRSKKTETIVWSILLLSDLTIVSGDSRGIVSFWDGKIGVLKYKIFTHKADILCLTLSTDKSCIYVSGVDPSVILLAACGKGGERWVKSHQRNMHTNDVMCLAPLGHKLISAGVDCDLTISSPPRGRIPKIVTKYPPLPKSSRILSSRSSRRIMTQDPREINIWQLPNENQEELVKLLEIKSSSGQIVHSSCFSPSGQLFGYCTHRGMHFFRLTTLGDGSLVPVKLKKHFTETEDSKLLQKTWTLHFLNNTQIIAVSVDGTYLRLIQFDTDNNDSVTLQSPLSLEDVMDPVGIDIVVVQVGGEHLALVTSTGRIHVIKISEQESITSCYQVPYQKCPVSSLEFHPVLPYLMIIYADHSVEMCNFVSKKIIFHEQIGAPNEKTVPVEPAEKKQKQQHVDKVSEVECASEKVFQPILGCAWSVDGSNKAILYELNKIHLMEFSEKRPTSRRSKCAPEISLSWKSLSCPEEYVSFANFLDCDQLLTVQVKPSVIFNKLPPIFAKKRFGM